MQQDGIHKIKKKMLAYHWQDLLQLQMKLLGKINVGFWLASSTTDHFLKNFY
jgi:hypothetical protein